ncbi:ERI1 exoribonuclease 3 [Pelodytes ibericus]
MNPCRKVAYSRGLHVFPAPLVAHWLRWPVAALLIGGRRLPVTAVSIDRGRVRGSHVNAAEDSMQCLPHVRPAKLPLQLLTRSPGAPCPERFYPLGAERGSNPMLNRRLGSQGFGASVAAMTAFPPQRYNYFLVLDFEATCDKPQIHPQEIIEFPILKLNGRTMEIESTFHTYVQPVVHPQLTQFCKELTGINQEMVDGQPMLSQVMERVNEWMAKEGLLDPSVKSIFVTCGDWDLKLMLPGQCEYLGLQVPDYYKQWINLKKAYSFAIGTWPKNGLLDMNKGLSLQHIGRPHSGIDDCRNIANIMKTLANRGFIFKQTSRRI